MRTLLKRWNEFGRILSKEGVKGLFVGNFANCLRVFPTGAITCTLYINLLKLTPADDVVDAMEPVWRGACALVAASVRNFEREASQML